ncbi:hypothetical protein [Nocardioides abyssi]|uniref:HNH endonuclease n=1 Tax=Nocardioides abyssi TaxID=3058370 RepID=A0ABT8EPN3_9ACTN|nr:hypothetical protein [Nocardioides abyssi]MDN4159978.1 hypothetical protein [Nocardioides abyssi]
MSTTAPKRYRRPPAAEITPDTPIWCPACQMFQPAIDFNNESRRYSGLATRCRKAQAAARQTAEAREQTRAQNKRRWANPEYRERGLEAARARRRVKGQDDLRKSRARLRTAVDEWKLQGCIDCGYRDIRAIEPDHRPGEVKVGNVSRLVTLCVSLDRLRAELAKCEPRCARCHRRMTATRRPNSWRAATTLPPSWRARLDRQDFNDALKMRLGCADCGWAGWARGLDWDHARGVKKHRIADLINHGGPVERLVRELGKCDVVCANCHRVRTSTRLLAQPPVRPADASR